MNEVFSGVGSRQAVQERTILKNVYLWMTGGLFLTAVVAQFFYKSGLWRTFLGNPILFFGLIIAQLVMVYRLAANIQNLSVNAAIASFGVYAALNGINLSSIFVMYRLGTIFTAFISTGALFGAMSLWAVTTKKDLASWGHYLMMGLLGIIIASLVNIFLRSDAMSYIISYVGVLLFTGLTAYDTQRIKNMSRTMSSSVDEASFVKLSILGALTLYLDFINMFLFILRLLGRRN